MLGTRPYASIDDVSKDYLTPCEYSPSIIASRYFSETSSGGCQSTPASILGTVKDKESSGVNLTVGGKNMSSTHRTERSTPPMIVAIDEQDRVTTTMTTTETTIEDLPYAFLLELLDELQTGVVRKPEHFHHLHFLLLLLYDAHGYPRDRYPLWRWYHRIKKKYLFNKHYAIETENSRQCILAALDFLISSEQNVSALMEEAVRLEDQYLHSPVHGLFRFYTPMHTFLYMEQVDRPIITNHAALFHFFQSAIIRNYHQESCDLVHFAIAHKNTQLLKKIFGEKIYWLDLSINLTTERGWLPLHYAAYVGDTDTVKSICDALTSPTIPIHFDTLSLLIPSFKHDQFTQNPNEYILQACGVEHDATPSKQSRASPMGSTLLNHHSAKPKEPYRSLAAITINNDSDIPDADELELSSLPIIQREEFIDKVLHVDENKQMLIPSPLILACLATCGEKTAYEEIVRILLDSHLVEFDGLNHESILNRVLDHMHRKEYALFQYVRVYRDTEIDGPSALVFYQFNGFIVNPDVKPLSGALSGSSATLNTSKNDESAGSDDGHPSDTPISVRCFLTVLVLRDIFLAYPRWDFHLLRENIEDNITDLENALGCRPTILYPDAEIISSRKRSDLTWEVLVKYRLCSETGQSIYMEVNYYFFESFGDPFADASSNVYQSPFYIACMTDSTVMMDCIFDSFFKRRHLHCWGTVAPKQLEHCFDGVLQMKNNYTTFLSLCGTLSRYYQVDGDPLMEENSSIIQRMFVHAFACCVRRNAKIELDYLIKNHALIYYDSCRLKPSDIRHNILTYCVVRNLATIFDQLMSNMKTMMYKTYQNSTNPDWQPHIAWREIIHVIIDPVSPAGSASHDPSDFTQLACYGDLCINYTSNGSIQILHTTGDEYNRSNNARNNLILKAKRKLPRALSDVNKQRPRLRRMNSLDQQPTKDAIDDECASEQVIQRHGSTSSQPGRDISLRKKSRNLLKNVNPLRWGGKYERHHSNGSNNEKRPSVPAVNNEQSEASQAIDAISLPAVNDSAPKTNFHSSETVLSVLSNQLQRCRTIDPAQARQHRSPLQHIQAILWPVRDRVRTTVNEEHEHIPMIDEASPRNMQCR